MTVYIYALCDPGTGEVRYVGKTISKPHHRLSQHLNHPKNSHKGCWLLSLQSRNLKPTVEVLETIENSDDTDWQEVERFWIGYLRFLGARLTNLEAGGIGGTCRGPETKAKLSLVWKGKKRPPEFREKMKTARIGFRNSPEAIDKIRAKLKGRKLAPFTAEHRARISAAGIGRKRTEEDKRRISEKLKGRKHSPEHVAKRVASRAANKK